jgi:hypothetical protein
MLTRSPKPDTTIKYQQGEAYELQQSQENLWESQGNQTTQVAFTEIMSGNLKAVEGYG